MNAPPKYAPPKYTPPGPVKSIGERAPLVDGPEKVTGRAKYAADYRSPGALVGRILRSAVAHANVIAVDTSAAEALPGVEAVVTGEDSDQTFGVLPIAMNEYPLARERVRYRGEPVAAVAAVDVETAQRALDLSSSSAMRSFPPISRRRKPARRGRYNCTRKSRATSNVTPSSSWATCRRALPKPTWCVRRPFSAPKSARCRANRTRPTPSTTPSVIA